ncbi:restriction endonuclease [Haloarcula sediminis]|uniref:restriction endonuclease n=1 Tax=Haloarcula sediminis TaxID=3111777 RepID=UPI002D78A696|nr:restriction endonuclease [Haloarcula sp. CK38]
MGRYGDQYVVDEEYRNSTALETNQYHKWLNGPLDGGINPQMGIGKLANPDTGQCEFLVFYSSDSQSQRRDPWDDIINMEDGIAYFWGDSKAGDGPDPLERAGNTWVKNEYCRTYAQNRRSEAPPVLLFQKEHTGYVTFKGVCLISSVNIERHKDGADTVVNYRIELDILDADVVDLEWIHRKARTGVDTGGPKAWNHWVDTGTVRRYSIYKERIRSKVAQTPEGQLADLHSDIRSRLDGSTVERGKKLELLLKRVLDSMDHVSRVELTPSSGDRGIDLSGKIDLMAETHLSEPNTKIDFKAQIKNKADSVGGRELSRLASRIDDGEIGLFFTMSYYTEGAQKENLSTYPVRLFSGRDIAELLVQTDLASKDRLNDAVVDEINNSV